MEHALNSCRQEFQETKLYPFFDQLLLKWNSPSYDQENNTSDPRNILGSVLNIISEENSTLFRCERKQFLAVATLLNSCVFEILQKVILKKIFLPPMESRNYAEKLQNFNLLFDREIYVDVTFELECARVGITSTSPDEVGIFPKLDSLFHDLSSNGVLAKLVRFVVECHSRLPDVWYYQIFYLQGLCQYSIHDLNEFNELRTLITSLVKSKCDWRIYYCCIQIISKIACVSTNIKIREASIHLMQSFIAIKSNSISFLNHWTLKSDKCRFALVRNIFNLVNSPFEDVRRFSLTAMNYLHAREKSLNGNENGKNCILDFLNDQSRSIRSERLACLQEESVLRGFTTVDIFDDFSSNIDDLTGETASKSNKESIGDPYVSYYDLHVKAVSSLHEDLSEQCLQLEPTNGNQYLSILNLFGDLRNILTDEAINSYQKQKDPRGLENFIVGKLGLERIEYIDDELFQMDETYSLHSLIAQLMKTSQDDSILSFLGNPAEFFLGKTLFLKDPHKRHSKIGEIKKCYKTSGFLAYYLSECWRLEIYHHAATIYDVRIVMKVSHSLDYHFKYYLQPRRHYLSLKSSFGLASGNYCLEPMGWFDSHYTHRLKSDCDGTEYKLHIGNNFVEVKSTSWHGHSTTFMLTREQLKCCRVEFEVFDKLYIDNQKAPQAIKVKDRVPDKAQIQRELFSRIEACRLSLIQDLINPMNQAQLKQLLSLVIEANIAPLPDSLNLQMILNELGDFSKTLDDISDLHSKLDDASSSFHRGQCLLEIILSANYATLVPRDNTVDLLDTMQLLNLAQDNAKQLEGVMTILFLGGTGAGKSTSVNYFTGVPLKESKNQFGHVVVEIDQKKARKRLKEFDLSEQAVIGQSLGTSQTSVVKGHKIHFRSVNSPLYLGDFPGFDDTRGAKYDMATAISIDKVIRNARKVCAVFLNIPYNSFLLDRGNPVIHSCARLLELLPNAFDDRTIELRQVRIIITKHSIYEGAESTFEEMLTKILSDEEIEFQKIRESNTYLNQSLLKNRISTWESLSKMYHNGCIEFIDICNSIRANEIISEYTECQGIDTYKFQSALDGPKIQELFRNSIEQGTHTWVTQILNPYLVDIPSKISSLQTEFVEMEAKIAAAKVRDEKMRSDIDEWSQQRFKYEEVQKQLLEGVEVDFSTLNLECLQASRISHLERELVVEQNRLLSVRKNLTNQISKIKAHEKSIQNKEIGKSLKVGEVKMLSTGVHVDVLWQYQVDPNEYIIYSSLKEGALEQAFNEFRETNESDRIAGSRRSIRASDYDGSFTHLVTIHRDYVLVPPHDLERTQFTQTGRTADGKYAATCEGKNFKLDLGRKSDESGKKLIYSMKTYWKSTLNEIKHAPSYDPSSLPYIVVKHTVPNEIKNAARLSNLKSEISGLDNEISFILGQLSAPKEEKKRLESEIDQITTRIADLSSKLTSEVASERSIQLQQLISDLNQSINSGYTEIGTEKLSIEANEKLKAEIHQTIHDLRIKKILYALLIKSHLRTARTLFEFCCDFENCNLLSPTSGNVFFEGFQRFISVVQQHSFSGLERLCDLDLRAKFGIIDVSTQFSHHLRLPHCLIYPTIRYRSLVESVSNVLQIHGSYLFDFLSTYLLDQQIKLQAIFPHSNIRVLVEQLRNGKESDDPIELHCLTHLLNCPIIKISNSELSTTVNYISADLSGDPIFLCLDSYGEYSCPSYPPTARKQIEIFLAQLSSLGGTFTF